MSYNILVVEGDAASALGLRDALSRLGHNVTSMAATGSEALRQCDAERPDLVLMDIVLPGPMTGVEAAHSIRRTQEIPVLFVTAHSDPATLSQAHEAEPYGFILKPFDADDLRVAIEVAIHRHRADTRLRESERRLATTLQVIGEAVISTDDRGVVNFVNIAAETLTGVLSRLAAGTPLASILTLLEPVSREPLPLNRESSGEAILLDGTGREVPVVFSIATIPGSSETSGPAGQVLAIREISDTNRPADPPKALRGEPVVARASEEELRLLLSVENKTKARIFLVEAHPITRHGMDQIINSQTDMEVCGSAEDAASALRDVEDAQPDLVIMDFSTDGLELLRGIRSTGSSARVLVLSMYDESVYAQRALRAGARGYIMKGEAPDKLLNAARRVLAGEVYLSEKESMRALDTLTRPVQTVTTTSPIELLSNRELEVFRWIGLGLSLREIAERLHLSVKTVETHCAHIKGKLNIANARELARQAILWIEDTNSRSPATGALQNEVRVPPG